MERLIEKKKSRRIIDGRSSSKRAVRKLTLANLALMCILFLVCIAALNVYTLSETNRRIDGELEYQLQGFEKSHLSPEEHSSRLPLGLLPVIYFHEIDGDYINPHPGGRVPVADAEALLLRPLPEGHSTQEVDGRWYRVYRVMSQFAQTFWEDGVSYQVDETVSIADVTSEHMMQGSLLLASIAGLIVSFFVFGIYSYRRAKATIEPINDAWERQRRFTADTSHELRNPLASVQANAELMLKSPDSTVAEQGERLGAILDGASRMGSLLSRLLTLARADAGGTDLEMAPVDMGALLEVLAARFSPVAQVRGVEMSVVVFDSCCIKGDSRRLDEMFSILIDNAIRYTPAPGEVTVECRKEKGRVRISVRDNGIGIPEDELDAMFARFHRGDRAREINPEGSGLGLPIAQWIAFGHGAELHFFSEVGKGTTVTAVFGDS